MEHVTPILNRDLNVNVYFERTEKCKSGKKLMGMESRGGRIK